MAVRSIVRDRGRSIGVVAALTASVALTSAPAAFGAVDGDPIASSTFTFKLSGGFKGQLKANGVKMKPKKLKLTKGDVDPTTGAADLRFGKVTFKKGNKKIVYKNLKGSMPGKVSDASSGKLFKLTAPTVARNGFGADLSGVKVKFLKSGAKKINKALGLSSLHKGTMGSFSLSYQPETVKVLGGTAGVTGVLTAGTVLNKLLFNHCGAIPGAIPPATFNPVLAKITFPVAGGTISPAGTAGVVNQAGGVRVLNAQSPGACASMPYGAVTQTDFAVNLALQNVQAHATIEASGTPGVILGDKGVAITQLVDGSNAVITADPAGHTISINGAIIQISEVSATTLNAVVPQPASTFDPAKEFKAADVFGRSDLTVTTR